MHKQVSGWTVNFGPNSPVYPLLRNTPPPFWKTSDLGWPKFTPKYPPMEIFRFGMPKVYSEIPPPPPWKSSDLGCPKFTPKYPPPIMENFRFGMTKVYSKIPPPWKTSDLGWPKFTPKYPPNYGKLQIWDDQSLLQNTPPHGNLQIWDAQSLLRNTPPIMENFRFGMTKVYSEIPPPNYGKLQIWDDQSLLRNTPPPWKTSPKFLNTPPPNNRKLSESSS